MAPDTGREMAEVSRPVTVVYTPLPAVISPDVLLLSLSN
jgi:hypothetical protein